MTAKRKPRAKPAQAPKQPDRPSVAIGPLSRLFNLTPSRIGQLTKRGVVIKQAHGEYDLWESVRGYIRFLQERLPEHASGDDPRQMVWKDRKDRAEALKAEKFLDMLDGEMLPRATVEAQQARIGHVCNALLRAFVSEFPPLGAGLSAPEIEAKAKAWVLAWAGKLADADSDVWTAAERDVSREMRGDAKKIAVAKSRKRT